jgi:hypothetical protein
MIPANAGQARTNKATVVLTMMAKRGPISLCLQYTDDENKKE